MIPNLKSKRQCRWRSVSFFNNTNAGNSVGGPMGDMSDTSPTVDDQDADFHGSRRADLGPEALEMVLALDQGVLRDLQNERVEGVEEVCTLGVYFFAGPCDAHLMALFKLRYLSPVVETFYNDDGVCFGEDELIDLIAEPCWQLSKRRVLHRGSSEPATTRQYVQLGSLQCGVCVCEAIADLQTPEECEGEDLPRFR